MMQLDLLFPSFLGISISHNCKQILKSLLGGGNRLKILRSWQNTISMNNNNNNNKQNQPWQGQIFHHDITTNTRKKHTIQKPKRVRSFQPTNLEYFSTMSPLHEICGLKKKQKTLSHECKKLSNHRLTTYQQSHGILIQPPLGLEDTFITTKSSSLQLVQSVVSCPISI